MSSLFKSNKVIALVDKRTGKIKVEEKIDIVLAPSFYWVKRAFLEVKFVSAALKYAPSIFEGILPEGHYAYYALKEDNNTFLFFAYNPDEIIAAIKDKGINSFQVSGIHFAQNELQSISQPIQCNSKDVLVMHNKTILQVKRYMVDETTIKRSLDDIKQLSKHKIVLHKSSVTHSMKALAPIMGALAALILLYATQLFFTYSQQQEIMEKPSVFKEYRLPETFMQNSSIEKKLRQSFKVQKSFRKLVHAILQLPLTQRQRIESLQYEKNRFVIVFGMDDFARLRDVELSLKNSLGSLVKIEINKNALEVKIK